MTSNFSRRRLLQGAAAAAGAASFGSTVQGFFGEAHAQTADTPAVCAIYFEGGYNALFSSADSFIAGNKFSCTASNVTDLGNGLFVDKATFGDMLPAVAKANMAALGINHGRSAHPPAQLINWTDEVNNHAIKLANAMGGNAPIRCANVGPNMPPGARPAIGNVSLQAITDMGSAHAALAGSTATNIPNRSTAAAALTASRQMSAARFAVAQNSLRTTREAYDASANMLKATPVTGLDLPTLATAYGLPTTIKRVGNFASQMMAAEMMIRAGARVVVVMSRQGWDTHGDASGVLARDKMKTFIMPALSTFLQRMMSAPGRNVTTALFGDFARSLPGSDHAKVTSATVFGKRVKKGTTGRVTATVDLPGKPGVPGLWAYLAAASGVTTTPFGANPHGAILLP